MLSDVTLNLDNSRNTGKDVNIKTVLSLEQLTLTTGKLVLIFLCKLYAHCCTQTIINRRTTTNVTVQAKIGLMCQQIYFEILYL